MKWPITETISSSENRVLRTATAPSSIGSIFFAMPTSVAADRKIGIVGIAEDVKEEALAVAGSVDFLGS